MEFRVKKYILEAVLTKASTVLAVKDLLPILKNFNVTVEGGKLQAVATDLELSVIAETELIEVVSEGRAVFPGKKLIEIVKGCDDAIISVKVDGQTAIITCSGASWSIQLMDATTYPDVPHVEDSNPFDVTRALFVAALVKVKGAAAKDSTRPALQMIDISSGKVRASDGAIFRQVTLDELGEVEMQLPAGCVDDLIKMLKATELEKIQVGQTEDHLLFIVGADVFIVTKNNVEYPDVEAMLLRPAENNKDALTVDRQQLINGIKRVRVTADEDTKGLVMSIDNNLLTLRARDKYGNFATQVIDVHWTGAARELGVNHENLLDTVQSLDSPSIVIRVGADSKTRKSSLFIEDNSIIAVLQQLKVSAE